MNIYIVLAPILAYLIGSVPTGYWLSKAWKGIDIRQQGSGSTGATNVWRCVGKGAGITVFLVDLFKGYLPVWAVLQWNVDQTQILPVVMGAAALFGHSKSIFLEFQGGKSAATGLGTLLALQPFVGLLTFVTWLIIVLIGRIVSLASILAVFCCIFFMALLHAPTTYVAYCVLGFLYVTYRHKSNIKRLLNHTEPRLGEKPVINPDERKGVPVVGDSGEVQG